MCLLSKRRLNLTKWRSEWWHLCLVRTRLLLLVFSITVHNLVPLVMIVVEVVEFKHNISQVIERQAHDTISFIFWSTTWTTCCTCEDDHMRKDCSQERGGWSSLARLQPAQVVCDNCDWVGHPRERCFDLHLEFKYGGRGHGWGASQSQGGWDDGGAGATRRPVVDVTPTTKTAMAARIEQL